MSQWPNSNPETRRKAGLPPQPEPITDDQRVSRKYKPRVATLLGELRRSIEIKHERKQDQ